MTRERARQDTIVGIVGLGTIGAGFARSALAAGWSVRGIEIDDARAHRLNVELQAEHGRLEVGQELGAVAGCSVVIEAVPERPDDKLPVLSAVAEIATDAAILATTTSSLAVTGLAATLQDPSRLIGLHALPPVETRSVVEVVPADQVAPLTIELAEAFVRALGKTPLRVKDRPGFIARRLLMPYLNQVAQALDDGLASARDIDLSLELGLGYPRGPLKVLDEIGIDDHVRATTLAHDATGDPWLVAPPLLTRLVATGRIGSKADRRLSAEE